MKDLNSKHFSSCIFSGEALLFLIYRLARFDEKRTSTNRKYLTYPLR